MVYKRPTESVTEKVTFKDTLFNIYYDLVPLVSLNILWFLLTLPIITALPAIAGIYYSTNQLTHQNGAGWKTFLEGFRKYFWVSWRWGLLNLIAVLILVSNLFFYGQYETQWFIILRGISMGIGVLWAIIQLYTFPFLLEQKEPKVWLALRNSLILFAAHPVPVVSVAILVSVFMVLSTLFALPAWFFLTVSLSAYLANKVVVDSLQDIKTTVSSNSNN